MSIKEIAVHIVLPLILIVLALYLAFYPMVKCQREFDQRMRELYRNK
jgi:apolipoprotein N-acyltransferase